MMKESTSTTLTVDKKHLRDEQFLDIHHVVTLDVDAPGINIWTHIDENGDNDYNDGELVWVDLGETVDNLLEYDDFEEFLIDDWITTFEGEIEKLKAYKAKLQENLNES